ncbi:MAG TPA: D-glycerate dehydrogenase [Syntrophobacteraceae bacterium]|nr:D-glycerate dehydrogenase [Syntrophobacteraceae bacterium]
MKVFVTLHLPRELLTEVEKTHEVEMNLEDRPLDRGELLDAVGDKDGLLCSIHDRIDEELLERASALKVIANFGVGYDHVDLEAATRRGIPVGYTPGVLTDATADIAFALILAVARRVVEGDELVRSGRFPVWAPFNFLGRQVAGKTLGIIGMGRIGKAVARRAAGFDMRVLYHNPNPLLPEEETEYGSQWVSLETLLKESDFVSLHVPLTPRTRHLIDRDQLALMKPSAFLINTSRGPVVKESALVEALRAGNILGAGLDVYENEPALAPGLADFPNVVLLPHVGSATYETRTDMGRMAVENLLAGLAGQRPPNCLNWERLPGGKGKK